MLYASKTEAITVIRNIRHNNSSYNSSYRGRHYGLKIWNKYGKLRSSYVFPFYAFPVNERPTENEMGKKQEAWQ